MCERNAEIESIEEDGVGLDVVTTHAEAKPICRVSDVRKAGIVDLRRCPFHPDLPPDPLLVDKRLVAAPVVEVRDPDERVQMVGERHGPKFTEGVPSVRKLPVRILEVEEGVEGVSDGDKIECCHSDAGDCDGHVTTPHEPIPFRAVCERRCTIRDCNVQPPVECHAACEVTEALDGGVTSFRVDGN